MFSTAQPQAQITVNGAAHPFTAGMTVADLIAALAIDPRQVAIECNRSIVPRSQYGATALTPGDVIELVRFIGGG